VNQQFYRNMALWVVILVMVLLLITMLRQSEPAPPEKDFTEFLAMVEAGQIQKVVIEEGHIRGESIDGEFTSYAPAVTEDLIKELREAGVEIKAQPKPESSVWRQVVIMWFPLLLFIGLWIFFIRQMQAGGGKAMSFGKSRARLLAENQQQVTFEDVAGVEESKVELEEIIAFLREPKKFTRLGGRIPKGVLLVGPPGTGCWGAPWPARRGCPSTRSPARTSWRCSWAWAPRACATSFCRARRTPPASSSSTRSTPWAATGHDEREQTLNQLLVEMDGFESNEGVIMIAATNRPDVLDPALLRPGRFDRRVVVPRPDLRGRLAILKVHTRHVALADDVDLAVVARGTPGFVGADLQNLVNEAALLAARRDAEVVSMHEFEEAKDKVLLGTARKSLIMTDEDKRQTAYHEAGHAIVAMLTPGADPVHKVTIIPRGMALGATLTMPEEDRYSMTREQLLAVIEHAMGGRAAEELAFGHFSTGAANDLRQATEHARRMVCQFGMSDRIGPVSLGDEGGDVFLGRDFVTRKEYSEQKAREVDEEVTRILSETYGKAKQLLEEHRDLLDRVSDALLERETLEGSELQLLVEGKPLPPLPSPIAPEELSTKDSEPERADTKPAEFPGKKLPDPEPVPG
jgi:cell division protease FtsH